MKYITTILCAIAFAICGISLGTSEQKSLGFNHPSISAATIQPLAYPTLPTFGQPKAVEENKERDTVFVDTYTAILPRPAKKVSSVKPMSIPAPIQEDAVVDAALLTPDKIPIDSVKNKVGGVREEYTPDSISPPEGSIILIVDGEEVYKR